MKAGLLLMKPASAVLHWNIVSDRAVLEYKRPAPTRSGMEETPGPSGRLAQGVAGAAAASMLTLLAPDSAAASETASAGVLAFLERLQEMGPYGPLLFVVTVAFAELIPLFPTQPLSLASGLLFGPRLGAALIVAATSVAATTAFYLARGVGRPLAEKVISSELRETGGSGGPGGAATRQLRRVNDAIEAGGWWEQFGAVALLRLTPVVPFSASNYLLGLSPLRFAPYITGTLAGMAVWSTVYASLGGASRALLHSGVEPDVLLADMADKAGAYTEDAAVAGLAVGAAVALAWATGLLRSGEAPPHAEAPPPADAKDKEPVQRVKDRV
ncbi:hypothetical protein WJX81_005382 [Elliptochloris bilobata]|uniref:VTT domain-containing protein n=1 Tax=Elliptochloris bilobata TaxID=381761 RepID=A0AAW1QVU0_9CHLO